MSKLLYHKIHYHFDFFIKRDIEGGGKIAKPDIYYVEY